MDRKDLAKFWIEYQKLSWSMTEADHLVRDDPKEGFSFILEVLSQADDEEVLAGVAIHLLLIIFVAHPYQSIEWVEKEALQNLALKKALEKGALSYQSIPDDVMPYDVRQRLKKLEN